MMVAALVDDDCEDGDVDDDGDDDDNYNGDGNGDGGSPVIPHGATVALRHVVRLILCPRPGRHHQSDKLCVNSVGNEYSGFFVNI